MASKVNSKKAFGANVDQYEHVSGELGCKMQFSVIDPTPICGGDVKLPVIYWLSGLTCTDRNFIEKAGAFAAAVKYKVFIVCPDTSPRGVDIEGDSDSWDFGKGAGFYVNATEPKWKSNYRMYEYVTKELPSVVSTVLPVNGKQSIMGHSMGGHGALTIAIKNAGAYKSVSAFAPICNPSQCPWGEKAFTNYLGADREAWKAYDATELVLGGAGKGAYGDILVDVGDADDFLAKGQLRPDSLRQACDKVGQKLTLRMQPGYDHSYFFIASFIDDHVAFHAAALSA